MALFAKHNEIEFGVGDIVRLYLKTQETGRRQGMFEGMVIDIRGEGENKTFTVRKMGADRIGIEQIFPLFSPWIEKVEVRERRVEGVRRAKLYYLRGRPKADIDAITHRAAGKGKMKIVTKPRKVAKAKKRRKVIRRKK